MTSNEINVSAPGKVILHGEHAVVYGKAAIAANLNLRCHLRLRFSEDSQVVVELPDVNINYSWSIQHLEEQLSDLELSSSIKEPVPASDENLSIIKKFVGLKPGSKDPKELAVISFLYIYISVFSIKKKMLPVSIYMKSDLPVGTGLGSSAAFSVSLAAALLQASGCISSEKVDDKTAGWNSSDRDIINKWAFIVEKVIHGRPSGIDNSVSTYGGALRFQKGQIIHINKMPSLSVMLVNTKVPRSTMVLVAGVRERYEKYTSIFEPVLSAIEAITEESVEVFTSLFRSKDVEDYSKLGELMGYNHQLLNLLGVGHNSLDQIVSIAKKHGLHSKLTGAGGGGCAFILIPPGTDDKVLETMKDELENCDFQVWKRTTVGGSGVLQHL